MKALDGKGGGCETKPKVVVPNQKSKIERFDDDDRNKRDRHKDDDRKDKDKDKEKDKKKGKKRDR